jgi:hypothetical protein
MVLKLTGTWNLKVDKTNRFFVSTKPSQPTLLPVASTSQASDFGVSTGTVVSATLPIPPRIALKGPKKRKII